jgi:hypothetical protein
MHIDRKRVFLTGQHQQRRSVLRANWDSMTIMCAKRSDTQLITRSPLPDLPANLTWRFAMGSFVP